MSLVCHWCVTRFRLNKFPFAEPGERSGEKQPGKANILNRAAGRGKQILGVKAGMGWRCGVFWWVVQGESQGMVGWTAAFE